MCASQRQTETVLLTCPKQSPKIEIFPYFVRAWLLKTLQAVKRDCSRLDFIIHSKPGQSHRLNGSLQFIFSVFSRTRHRLVVLLLSALTLEKGRVDSETCIVEEITIDISDGKHMEA